MGSLRVRHNWAWLHFHFSLSCIGKGNGNPFQCSCLKNPRDGGAWWAAIDGVAQSRTRLKWLSSSSSHTECCQPSSAESSPLKSLTLFFLTIPPSTLSTPCPASGHLFSQTVFQKLFFPKVSTELSSPALQILPGPFHPYQPINSHSFTYS